MNEVLSGILIAEYGIVALFFLRFWNSARDRLFLMFAAAFLILIVQRVAMLVTADLLEHQAPLYVLRLTAFIVIIYAFIDKNRR